jgi:small redox-active disulfide protein 2
MVIKILGTGCPNCKRLEQVVKEVISENNVDASIEKVEDVQKIMEYGVMSTPALVINEKVKVFGRIPKKNAIKMYIEEEKVNRG